jgi:acyl-CoA thioester hydrolase
MAAHVHPVQIYYEDTDFSGIVYHPNYLKYFERAREHLLGVDELVRLYRDDGIGFVVHRCSMHFREGARHGDRLEIHTEVRPESEYRLIFDQRVMRPGSPTPLVVGEVQLVCVNQDTRLVPLPKMVLDRLRAAGVSV